MAAWTLLDAAASGGIIADVLVRQVAGIDLDRHAIGFGKGRFQRPNLGLLVADATRSPVADDGFDIALSRHLY